jgi:large subunit ribosomal protein L7/L12
VEDALNLCLRNKMASITKDHVIDFIANMSVLEMSELVKEMEEKFGVSAAAAAVAAPAAAG